MFPGYVTTFKDEEGFVHLYFYPVVDNEDNLFYRDLNLSNCKIPYEKIENEDNSKEYIFKHKNIAKIVCKLVDNKGKMHIKELII